MRVVLVGVVLAVGSAVAAPVPRAVVQRERLGVEGTVWAGDGVTAPTTYSFEKGGVLVYAYNGATYRNGTWKQDGAFPHSATSDDEKPLAYVDRTSARPSPFVSRSATSPVADDETRTSPPGVTTRWRAPAAQSA